MDWELKILIIAVVIFIAAIALLLAKKPRNHSDEIHGVLNVDCSDPADGAYLYLELTVPIAEVADRKQVTFKVNVIPDISQK